MLRRRQVCSTLVVFVLRFLTICMHVLRGENSFFALKIQTAHVLMRNMFRISMIQWTGLESIGMKAVQRAVNTVLMFSRKDLNFTRSMQCSSSKTAKLTTVSVMQNALKESARFRQKTKWLQVMTGTAVTLLQKK